MARSVHVLPHTHWDREWYDPFPTFRVRLVDLLDELLPRLEGDDLAHFQLDGQMAVVDDYLEVRPDAVEPLRRLNGEGRLSMGPWYVLPDEFLVSGETLVRDLQLGFRRAEQLGTSAMEVGYLPDMFGHVAAMPQLLRLFGMEHAVVWRGVPSTVRTPAFCWRSPDGSAVRAEYLPAGYGNGSDMPADAETLAERIELFAAAQGHFVGDRILWMAGMDHEVPPAHLGKVAADLDATDGWSVRLGSLAEYLDAVAEHDGDLPVHDGELRSGARANLLMGVTSNRVDVKVAAARAERALERTAEPLLSLWSADPQRWQALLDIAWREVVRNAAHDSICACSHDEVVDAVLHRYAEAARTATGVAEHAVRDAAARFAAEGTYLLNPTAFPRGEVVDVVVPADGEATDAVQVLEEHPAEHELYRTGAADAPIVLGRELIFEHPEVVGVRFDPAEHPTGRAGTTVTLHLLPVEEDGALSPADALGELGRRCAQDADLRVVTVLHRARPTRRVLARSPEVPSFGWARWQPQAAAHPVGPDGQLGLSNGLVTVVAAADGTFSLDGVAGFGRLVDEGDAGDTYNWSPPDHDVQLDRPEEVHVTRTEAGPMRGVVVIDAAYVLPERVVRGADGGWARTGRVRQDVRTTIELRADEPFVRVTTELDNRARDHRLRVHLPLPERAATSQAECAYGIVERPLWAEGGPNEWGIPTFPSRRFVSAGGLTVSHEGLCEYELVDLDGDADAAGTTAGELALTLVRATGWLSRGPMRSRPLPAGPELELEGAQVRKPLTLRYALSLDTSLDSYELADRVWSPLVVADSDGDGDLPGSGSHLEVHGVAVDALLREGEALVLRGHEPSGRPGELRLPGRTGTVVDLRGREVGRIDGSMPLRAHQIVTVRLDP
jgi:mannosylglycerate hydrolase